jgi:hypothetical protein
MIIVSFVPAHFGATSNMLQQLSVKFKDFPQVFSSSADK